MRCDEGVLRHVLGLRPVAEQRVCDPADARPVPLDEHGKRVLVAVQRRGDEPGVGRRVHCSTSCSARPGSYAPGLPAMPQCFGETPWTTTWMCSGAAPLDSASAFVRLSMILGTDSSVTRVSYSFTSIQGMSALLLSQDES